MLNRVRFEATFHGEPADGVLTFEDDGKFSCAFSPKRDKGKVCWPFRGRWVRIRDLVSLTTPHGLVHVTLHVNHDQTLTGLSQAGGIVNFDIRGARSTPLARELPISRAPEVSRGV